MPSQTVIIQDEIPENLEEFHFDETNIKEKRRRKIKMESGTEVRILPPSAATLRGRKPDIIILRSDVSEEFYKNIIVPMAGYHGVIIDESKTT